MKNLFYCALLLSLAIMSSCKKDDDVTPIPDILLSGDTNVFEVFDDTVFVLNAVDLKKGLAGVWSVAESNDVFALSDSTAPDCQFSGVPRGVYKLKWTVKNGKEEKSAFIVIKMYTSLPAVLITGNTSDFELYDTTMCLNGIELDKGLNGTWSVVQNSDLYSLSDASKPNCTFGGALLGDYNLRWTVENGKEEKSADISIKIVGFTDSRDGEKYKAVKIGDQIWMAEDLRTQVYGNANSISNGSTLGDYETLIEPKYWFAYNDNLSNVSTYGRLYTWYVVNDIRGLSPRGWHVASDAEWNQMQVFLGMNESDKDLIGISENGVSAKLKETGTGHWLSPNSGANNQSGFTALPGGYRRRADKDFRYIGEWCFYWTSTEYDYDYAYYRSFSYDTPNISRSYNYKNYGFSVRCVKN